MTTTVTVLGTGIMGSGMARSLVRAGFDVTVWNRSPDAALILAGMREAGTDGALMAAIKYLFDTAEDAGHAADDMAAVVAAIGPARQSA